MKLKKVKLSGFKSFVDPTTIQLESNLTGIVGPNGCGKSNIIDAVRWVMGEISAKQLRSTSMSEVIFNGSSARKPVGKAVVELIFDNSDGDFGGEYAKYSEISIRREVNREGFSDYFLNNANCRRKDITGIFLGTGLGSNSYAVIEQGMITRFIEAKPDDLRVYIEEAAGISKYKERRRETENRIKRTKENLSRINDIIEEVSKQLKHLKSQVRAAERYQKLKGEERLTKAELQTLHWRDLDKNLKAKEIKIQEEETKLEKNTGDLNVLNAKIGTLREEHTDDIEKFNNIQADFYRIGGNVARLEQQIKHTKERREQLTNDLAQVNQVWQEIIGNKTSDQKQLESYLSEKQKIEMDVQNIEESSKRAKEGLDAVIEEEKIWLKSWENFNDNTSKLLQLLEVERTRAIHLEERILEEEELLVKLRTEYSGLDFSSLNVEIEESETVFKDLESKRELLNENIATKQQHVSTGRDDINRISEALDQTRNKLQALGGRKSSLEALQQAALGKNDAVLVDWMKLHGLEQKNRLVEDLDVDSEWERAVETVLGVYLEAVCVDDLVDIAPSVKSLTHGNLSLLDLSSIKDPGASRLNFPTLSEKINSRSSVNGLLRNVYVASDINEALEIQENLKHDESVVTKDGIWLGPGWLRVFCGDDSPKTGILHRERELQKLSDNIKEEKESCKLQERKLEEHRDALKTLEEDLYKLQQELHYLMTKHGEAQSEVATKKTYLKHLKERSESLNKEIEVHENNLNNLRKQFNVALKNREEADEKRASNDSDKQKLVESRDQIQNKLLSARESVVQSEQDTSSLTLRLQLLQTKVGYITQSLDRDTKRLGGLKEQQVNVEKALSEVDSPLPELEIELQEELERRLVVENNLVLAKQKISGVEQELRDLEEKQSKCQETNEAVRLLLEKIRTERQGLQVRSTTYQEQVSELELDLNELNEAISEDANTSSWEEKLAHLTSRIERLGLINLAAIEEHEKLQERKDYLDAQNQDLVSALNTLEDAIRKIDQDTKERFKTAYNAINEKFQELFPKVFNGGKASLEQTENNLLETGVAIMAQPPGKRNSSIHSLSGGEKALTAIALIFSIFHLNPAPFCILDEVDAPLDDANVMRFCNLVREMAKSLQFVFITHNKITMEISEHLIGVTMQEPGVSRLVTVDIDAAISMAESDEEK